MTLSEKQAIFALNVSKLIEFIFDKGYACTLGEAYRTPEQAAMNAKNGTGIKNSCHTIRLAVDLNLFKDGKWLRDTADHEPIGLYWEALHPENCWGGRFGDGNHYSMQHNGVK
jgi:hypothetical protein